MMGQTDSEGDAHGKRNRLVIVSETALFDQRRAQRTAYLSMIDHLSARSGVPSALVAQVLHRPAAPADDDAPPAPEEEERLRQTARGAIDHYMAARNGATGEAAGLAEALITVRGTLRMRGDGSGEALVGVSALPPPALRRYLGGGHLRSALDGIYSASAAGPPTEEPAAADGWIVELAAARPWPSADILESICSHRRVAPHEALFIGSDLRQEVGPAMALGMRGVYVRLGILDERTPLLDGPAAPAPADLQRPDAIVTRVQDLPRLPFLQARENTPRQRPTRER